jgi:hypothetical protein
MTEPNQKPGEGLPRPGVHARVAVEQWAIGKLIAYRQAAGLNTAIIGDFRPETMTMTPARVQAGGAGFDALLIECDTDHGDHFRQIVPWDPGYDTLAEIIRTAGGVIHI